MGEQSTIDSEVQDALVPLTSSARDHDRLLDAIGDARFVLLGEATHGTHEFYRERALITRRLIEERGFDAVAIEADWPDAYRVDDFVKRRSDDRDAAAALAGFMRFPQWMWRNRDVVDFVTWLRAFDDTRSTETKVGFYGLDLYSMYASIEAVLQYLDGVDPEAAARARARYACFGHYGIDTNAYAYATGLKLEPSCESGAAEQLTEMRQRTIAALERAANGKIADALFYAEQNARLVKNAEQYYRCMFEGAATTWNLRDRHMADTLAAIVQYLDHRLGRACKIVIWAHNSHLGDARATDMTRHGELNLGQLARERHGRDAFLVGFTTYDGTVTAASDWDKPPERKSVRPAMAGSYEAIFHGVCRAAGLSRFALVPDRDGHLPRVLRRERFERAIGVVYRPDTERVSHWFRAHLADQFDAVVHVDRTRAVVPLERSSGWHGAEPPETFPFAV